MQAGEHANILDVPHRRGAEPHAVGTAVGLMIDAKQVSVLR